MAGKMEAQTRGWIARSETQEELMATLVAFTERAKAKTAKPAKFQEIALDWIQKIAIQNGRATGGLSLGDCISDEQHHRIAQWGDKAFCLTEKQMAVIVRENWDYIKS